MRVGSPSIAGSMNRASATATNTSRPTQGLAVPGARYDIGLRPRPLPAPSFPAPVVSSLPPLPEPLSVGGMVDVPSAS